jgi:Rad3-related DNA helicase
LIKPEQFKGILIKIQNFKFDYDSRQDKKIMDEQYKSMNIYICRIIKYIPGGVLFVFSSKNFMRSFYKYWQESNITEIPIFLEPDTEEEAKQVKEKYDEACQ